MNFFNQSVCTDSSLMGSSCTVLLFSDSVFSCKYLNDNLRLWLEFDAFFKTFNVRYLCF